MIDKPNTMPKGLTHPLISSNAIMLPSAAKRRQYLSKYKKRDPPPVRVSRALLRFRFIKKKLAIASIPPTDIPRANLGDKNAKPPLVKEGL
jgi:hypothetical protein